MINFLIFVHLFNLPKSIRSLALLTALVIKHFQRPRGAHILGLNGHLRLRIRTVKVCHIMVLIPQLFDPSEASNFNSTIAVAIVQFVLVPPLQ